MKIRTDFITNSSSSSYCVSFDVVMASKKIMLDYWPNGEDGSGAVYVVLRSKRDDVVEQIKNVTSTEELKTIIIKELDFSDLYCGEMIDVNVSGDVFTSLIEALDSVGTVEYLEERAVDTKSKLENFCTQMDKVGDFSRIKEVVLQEYFTGWGEFACDAVDDFLNVVAGCKVNKDDEDEFKKVLKDKLSDELIDVIYENHCKDNGVGMFNAYINTTINLTDGTVTTECVDIDMDC